MARADLSVAYANSAFIEGADELPEQWQDEAANFRAVEQAVGRARLNLPYGPHERHALDLFLPTARPEGLFLFIHGGYWMQCDRQDFSHFSRGFCEAGWAVALPSYRLAPQARIAEITGDIALALGKAASLMAGPIVVAGHSAGGHLALRMNCLDVAIDPVISARLWAILAMSPLADLRPLMQTDMNATLNLDQKEASAESPVLADNRRQIPTKAIVGAEERPAFLDQAHWLNDAWPEAELHIAPGRNHFDILDMLVKPQGPIAGAFPAP